MKRLRRFFLTLAVLVALSAGIVWTQDYSFGNITVNGIAPVVASSPGAGIAHFAGSTQTVTSSAVSLTADVSGILPIANGGSGNSGANTFFQDFTGVNVNGGIGSAPTTNQIRLNAVYITSNVTLNNIAYEGATADNTANSYDIGAYGPGCLAGTAGIPLAFHTGTLAGTVLFPSAGNFFTHAITGGPVTIAQGWYCFAFTSNAVTPLATVGGATGGTAQWSPWASSTATGGGTTLPSTITAPATSFANHNWAFLTVF